MFSDIFLIFYVLHHSFDVKYFMFCTTVLTFSCNVEFDVSGVWVCDTYETFQKYAITSRPGAIKVLLKKFLLWNKRNYLFQKKLRFSTICFKKVDAHFLHRSISCEILKNVMLKPLSPVAKLRWHHHEWRMMQTPAFGRHCMEVQRRSRARNEISEVMGKMCELLCTLKLDGKELCRLQSVYVGCLLSRIDRCVWCLFLCTSLICEFFCLGKRRCNADVMSVDLWCVWP